MCSGLIHARRTEKTCEIITNVEVPLSKHVTSVEMVNEHYPNKYFMSPHAFWSYSILLLELWLNHLIPSLVSYPPLPLLHPLFLTPMPTLSLDLPVGASQPLPYESAQTWDILYLFLKLHLAPNKDFIVNDVRVKTRCNYCFPSLVASGRHMCKWGWYYKKQNSTSRLCYILNVLMP